MNISTTVTLTRDEVLSCISDHIRRLSGERPLEGSIKINLRPLVKPENGVSYGIEGATAILMTDEM